MRRKKKIEAKSYKWCYEHLMAGTMQDERILGCFFCLHGDHVGEYCPICSANKGIVKPIPNLEKPE
jgi:hypothetical protein